MENMPLLDASTLKVGDILENINAETGTVVAVNPQPHVNCVAVAWQDSGVWLYSRNEHFPGVIVRPVPPYYTMPVLPTDALNSLYRQPDPTNWMIQALLAWRRERNGLARIADNGVLTPEDHKIAWYACTYLRDVLDKSRGFVIDSSQN